MGGAKVMTRRKSSSPRRPNARPTASITAGAATILIRMPTVRQRAFLRMASKWRVEPSTKRASGVVILEKLVTTFSTGAGREMPSAKKAKPTTAPSSNGFFRMPMASCFRLVLAPEPKVSSTSTAVTL